jgi:hypothetical protein
VAVAAVVVVVVVVVDDVVGEGSPAGFSGAHFSSSVKVLDSDKIVLLLSTTATRNDTKRVLTWMEPFPSSVTE